MSLFNTAYSFVPGVEEFSLLIGLMLTSFFYKKYQDYNEEAKYQDMIDQLCEE